MAELRAELITDDISQEEAAEYLEELELAQLLVSELEPNVSGTEFFQVLLTKLQQLTETEEICQQLKVVDALLKDQSVGIGKYEQIKRKLQDLLPEAHGKDFIQTDLFLHTQRQSLDRVVVETIRNATDNLHRIFGPEEMASLRNFRQAFTERYDAQEIALTEVLDPECGIGYDRFRPGSLNPTPLIDALSITEGSPQQQLAWDQRQAWIAKRFVTAAVKQERVVTLTAADIEALDVFKQPVAYGASVLGTLVANSSSVATPGNWQFLVKALYGPTCLHLLSRFMHGSAADLQQAAQALLPTLTESDNVVHAEIVHLPQARTGNILLRPELLCYEIPYLSRSLVSQEHQILLEDLFVSVRDNRIILRSARLNKEIRPFHTSAFNTDLSNLVVFRFLSDLQHQEYNAFGLAWNWSIFREYAFTPRVEYQQFILAPAKWNIQLHDLPDYSHKSPAERIAALRHYLTSAAVPDQVLLREFDNELLIDTRNEHALSLLGDELLKKSKVSLVENFQLPEHCLVNGPDGRFTNEFIVPCPLEADGYHKPEARRGFRPQPQVRTKREYAPGEEWLYLKLYCGAGHADAVLTQLVGPLVRQLCQEGKIEKWFFIRYHDSANHLRLRFYHSTNQHFWPEIIARFNTMLVNQRTRDLVRRVQLDTYERELERYGFDTIRDCEQFFCIDSKAVLDLIDLEANFENDEKRRWSVALLGVNQMLEDFGYSLTNKQSLLNFLYKGFFAEFAGGKSLQVQLDQAYRRECQHIAAIMQNERLPEDMQQAHAILLARSSHTAQLLAELRERIGDPMELVRQWMPSFIHMFLNRLFTTRHRQHELVTYHYLAKHYESQLARQRKMASAAI